MKKIIYFLVISFFGFFLFSNLAMAADPECVWSGPGRGRCRLQCEKGEQSVPLEYGACAEDPGTLCCVVKKDETGTGNNTNTNTNNSGFGFNTVADVAKQAGYNNQTDKTIEQRVSSIIAVVLSFLGVIFMALMIYGGYMWMTASGDEQKIEKARDVIRSAIIGLIIVIAAYAISVFVISRLWGAELQTPTPTPTPTP